MKLKMFAVYDSKAECYGTPFFMQNKAMAIRSFADIAKDPQTTICKHPEDYSIFMLGEYDDQTGVIEKENPVNLGHPISQRDFDGDEMLKLTKNNHKEAELVS